MENESLQTPLSHRRAIRAAQLQPLIERLPDGLTILIVSHRENIHTD